MKLKKFENYLMFEEVSGSRKGRWLRVIFCGKQDGCFVFEEANAPIGSGLGTQFYLTEKEVKENIKKQENLL
jgi:hypothetical protein